MKKKFWSSDKIVSLTAIFISIMTLIIFVRQTNIIERQSKLSAMPYLSLETSENGEDFNFSIALRNYGVGPAIIKDRMIYYKGESYDLEFVDFLRQEISGMDTVNIISNSTVHRGLAIPAGGQRLIIKVGGNAPDYYKFLQVMQQLSLDSLDYKITYKSIYDEYWHLNATTPEPQKID